FEFRAVGSKQSPSFPIVVLNAAVAQSFIEVTAALKAAQADKEAPSEEDILSVIRQFAISSKKIRFEGNGYSDEWIVEAEKRGLPNLKACTDAFKRLLEPHNSNLLTSLGVLSQSELSSRYHIMVEKYAKDLVIEANTLSALINNGVLPAAFSYRKDLADSINSQATAGVEATPEKKLLVALTNGCMALTEASEKLDAFIEKVEGLHEEEQGEAAGTLLTAAMEEVRSHADALEKKVADKYWPFPKYTELLF
ncbi:hypothetical protein HDU80_010951, partial [Chytriomyces hyalinus]